MAHGGAQKRAAELAITALVSGMTQDAAAKAAGIGRRTLVRWLREDAKFQAALEAARREVFAGAADRAGSRVDKALDTLEGLLASELDFARLGAARALVESAVRLREIATLADRVARIEAQLACLEAER